VKRPIPEPPGPSLSELPQGPVHLDFEILAGLPRAHDEWEARAAWLAHLRAHGEALAVLAVDQAEGEARERAQLAADRLRALLRQGYTTLDATAAERFDLAAPLPELAPWPPVFAGGPVTPELKTIMAAALRWEHLSDLAAWARALAYYATGMQSQTPPAVRALARKHLHRLLDAAEKGLDVGEAREPAPARTPPKAKRTKAARKGGRR
jgi:hypothetical protein